MARRKRRSKGKKEEESFDSDDERAYSKEEVPDKDEDDYYHDEVDQFHMNEDKIMLDSGAPLHDKDDSGKEEVLAFDDDDSSDEDNEQYQVMKARLKQFRSQGFHEEIASDIEEEPTKKPKKDDQNKSWGTVKSKFYGGHDSDIDEDLSGSEPEAAALEEQEALAIQKRLLQEMDDDDVGLDLFKPAASLESVSSEKISKDLSQLSKRERMQLLKKQSPELLELIDDYKIRVAELQDRLLPVFKLIKEKKLSSHSSGAKLVYSKVHIYLNYLVNLSFYVMLKAKQTPVEHHPVIKRLLQYRNIMKQTDALEEKLAPELDVVLERIQAGEEFSDVSESSEEDTQPPTPVFKSKLLHSKKKKPVSLAGKKRLSEMLQDSDSDGVADVNKGGRSWGRKRSKPSAEPVEPALGDDIENVGEMEQEGMEEGQEEEGDERRAINYQIEKNKGLTTRKRKELRNPRVKHKMKYRKAKISRKGQVREVRKETERYGGEMSGIRAGIKKSVKFKA